MVGADLANLVNEAALLAARRDHEQGRAARTSPTRSRRSCSAPSASVLLAEADRRRTAYHEARPRARRHAHAGRRPGAQGLDHPARPGARRHALDARRRPLQLLRGRAAGARSRSRSAAASPRRSCTATITTGAESDIQQLTEIARRHGRALGHERRRSAPIAVLPRDGQGPLLPGRRAGLRGHPAADRRGGAPDRRGRARARSRAAAERATASGSTRWPRRCCERETLDEADAYAAAGSRGARARRRPDAGCDRHRPRRGRRGGRPDDRGRGRARSPAPRADQPEGAGGAGRAAGGREGVRARRPRAALARARRRGRVARGRRSWPSWPARPRRSWPPSGWR